MRLNLNSLLPGVLAPQLLLPPVALAQAAPSWSYGDWPGPWHMWGWGFGWIFPVLV